MSHGRNKLLRMINAPKTNSIASELAFAQTAADAIAHVIEFLLA
jgi:hypothetical protein